MSVLTEQALKKMKVPDLKAELKLRKLKVSGKKDELIQRLLAAQMEGAVPGAGGGNEDDLVPTPPAQNPPAKQQHPGAVQVTIPRESTTSVAPTSAKRKAEQDQKEKNDAKKKKPEPPKDETEISEDESEDDGEGSKDDYKDEGHDDDDDDDEEDDDASIEEDIKKPLTASGWGKALEREFKKKYFKEIRKFEKEERKNLEIYPRADQVFNAFIYTPIEQVKVVIIGQDPYPTKGKAHGLCFSVMRGVKIPPSLQRIYKCLEKTVPGFKAPKHGCLEEWARRGVLMLNSTLTVRRGKSNSHEACGWRQFTDNVIKILCKQRKGLIFFLWGKFAQRKGKMINTNEHFVLSCSHPSPMGTRGVPWSCDHFTLANTILERQDKQPIDWRLSPK